MADFLTEFINIRHFLCSADSEKHSQSHLILFSFCSSVMAPGSLLRLLHMRSDRCGLRAYCVLSQPMQQRHNGQCMIIVGRLNVMSHLLIKRTAAR